jgi:NAD(P)-dependent dehydrogenase (short-subunit alcohol dehydrogenase family)
MKLSEIQNFVEGLDNIDGYVHSAGVVDINPIKFFKPDLYEQIRSTNLDSFIYLMNAMLKRKKINNKASIVLLSSISGLYGMKGNGLYGMTKAALNIAAKTYANELSKQKIRVNSVAPGMVKTQITLDTIDKLGEDQIKSDEEKYPLGYGEPEDVAYPICFLLSDAAKWITGEVMVLDGGRTAVI